MDTQVFDVTQDTQAVTQESAPVEETLVQDNQALLDNAVIGESATPLIDEPEKEPKAVQELKAQRKKRQLAEQEAAYWRGVAEAQKQQPAPTEQATVPSGPPRFENFPDWDTFEAARDQYLIAQAEQRVEQKLVQQTAERERQHVEQRFAETISKAVEDDPTFLDILQDNTLPITQPIADVLKTSDNAVDIIRYLNDNRNITRQLSQMDSTRLHYEIGKIEAKIEATRVVPEPPKRVSMAPEPIQTVKPTGVVEPDPDTMPIEDWMKRYGAPSRR